MTSQGQPLDHSIIQQFKRLYSKQLLQKAIADLDYGDSRAIDVLDAVYWMASAQAQIKPETVKKYFLLCGFNRQDSQYDEQTIDTNIQLILENWL